MTIYQTYMTLSGADEVISDGYRHTDALDATIHFDYDADHMRLLIDVFEGKYEDPRLGQSYEKWGTSGIYDHFNQNWLLRDAWTPLTD